MMARLSRASWTIVVAVGALAGCLPKFAPPAVDEQAVNGTVAVRLSKASPHPGPAQVDPGATTVTFGPPPVEKSVAPSPGTSGSKGDGTASGTGNHGNDGNNGNGTGTSPVPSGGATAGNGSTGTPSVGPGGSGGPIVSPSPDPDIPPTIAPITESSSTPPPTPTATDIIYAPGNFKSTVIAGGSVGRSKDGDGTAAVVGTTLSPVGMALENGHLWFTDPSGNQVRLALTAAPNTVVTEFGDPSGRYEGGVPGTAYMQLPGGLAYDPGRKVLYSSDDYNGRIYRLNIQGNNVGRPPNSFDAIAGGELGPERDGPGSGTGVDDSNRALFATPKGVALVGDALYVADSDGRQIRKIDLTSATFMVSTIAKASGDSVVPPSSGNEADDPTNVHFGKPAGMVASLDGKTLYVADTTCNVIWAINLTDATAKVKVFAGLPDAGFKDGPSGTASFNAPLGLAIDKNFLYVSEKGNFRIRMVALSDGSVTTMLGQKAQGNNTGDKSTASFYVVAGLYADLDANQSLKTLYVYDGGSDNDNIGARLLAITP